MLCVEAVVNPTNESLTDKNPISARLFELAGPELREECKAQIVSKSSGPAGGWAWHPVGVAPGAADEQGGSDKITCRLRLLTIQYYKIP